MSFPETSLASVATEGRQARYRGDPATANPYPEGSEDHAVWKRAWETPEREAPDGRV
ncbi:hypothetical protein [Methylobacterium sp. B4]|uniref:hypothetical protein n=1 Tax=Methylobacterium sp. B4 TaxID=1938755 RepID=UPI000D86038C|nr:hypothetical protein [Methylobacterium sp. B4]PXW61392.1 hypothetical protein BY998_10893 [Methylobacterium sp. B4]